MRPLALVCLLALLPADASAAGVSTVRIAHLARGINLSARFTEGASPLRSGASPRALAELRAAGFTFCRLPLDPAALFNEADPGALLNVAPVDRVVDAILGAGLAVVIDPIHPSSANVAFEARLARDPRFARKVAVFWAALARHYASRDPDFVFFEIMNEPHASKLAGVREGWWPPVQARLARAIRSAAPRNTIIATGEDWGGIDGLLALAPLADPDVVYSFHFYEPFTFTHQGARWAGPVQAELRDVPYPSDPESVERALSATGPERARRAIEAYGRERWGPARLRFRIREAARWGALHRVLLLCGEFGVYKTIAPASDRYRWIRDARRALEESGIGWAMWDFDGGFGLLSYEYPSVRSGPTVDNRCLAALGMRTLQHPTERSPLDAFERPRASRLSIPLEWLGSLWTRDRRSGSLGVRRGSKGSVLTIVERGRRDWSLFAAVALPVKRGEVYALSSRAEVEGAGRCRLVAAAFAPDGRIVSWSLASAESGPRDRWNDLGVRFAIPEGVASIVPGWLGTGPATIQVVGMAIAKSPPGIGSPFRAVRGTLAHAR